MALGKQPLPSIEELLRKRAAGDKLTRAEAGKLGGAFRGNRKPPEPARPEAAPRRLAVADGMAEAGPVPVLVTPAVDPDLCRQTAGEILDTLNEAGLSTITAKAEAIKAAPGDVKKFRDMAALKPGARLTMVNTAPSWLPKLLRVAGLDPQNAPEAMAGLAGVLWGVGFFRASNALDGLAKEHATLTKPKPEAKANGPQTP